jgi:CrcB protein
LGENGAVRAYLLVAGGGALGAALRWWVGELIDRSPGEFPLATLLVNIVGCVLAGVAVRTLVRSSDRWLAAMTGFLGGLTTFSAFAVETRELLDHGRSGSALAYVAATMVGGLAATEIARGDWRTT